MVSLRTTEASIMLATWGGKVMGGTWLYAILPEGGGEEQRQIGGEERR